MMHELLSIVAIMLVAIYETRDGGHIDNFGSIYDIDYHQAMYIGSYQPKLDRISA